MRNALITRAISVVIVCALVVKGDTIPIILASKARTAVELSHRLRARSTRQISVTADRSEIGWACCEIMIGDRLQGGGSTMTMIRSITASHTASSKVIVVVAGRVE